jgi:hypothetical protein
VDLGEYCRSVEEHLTRVNDGHLVRIAGTGFERVRQWALDGIPLSVVCRGIDLKAERHRTGRSRRPLRIEFCDGDVRDVYEHWRRAVGVSALTDAGSRGAAEAGPDAPIEGGPPDERRRPSLARQLDRIVEKLGRAAGRLDAPEPLRDAIAIALEQITALRDEARGKRRSARAPHGPASTPAAHGVAPGDTAADVVSRLSATDRLLIEAARDAAGGRLVADLRAAAERDLVSYRGRMPAKAWSRCVEAATEQSLRDRFGLPTFDVGV